MKRLIPVLTLLFLCLGVSLAFAGPYDGKRILFIDSYHEGYAWSDGILEGVQGMLEGTGIELKVIHMDTKRNPDEEFKINAALEAKSVIESFQPDVVIAADDNASQYLIAEYYRNADLPFVFCGVNWDASTYGYPYSNTTGMVEVAPVEPLFAHLLPMAQGTRIGVLTADTPTEQKEINHLKNTLGISFAQTVFVTTMDEWEQAFLGLQGKVDILLLSSNSGINDWDDARAQAFVEANTTIPTGSTYDFMAPFVLLSFAKSSQEQGGWAADAALQILDGTSPADIPITQNKEGQLFLNAVIAEKVGAPIPAELIESATILE